MFSEISVTLFKSFNDSFDEESEEDERRSFDAAGSVSFNSIEGDSLIF